MPQPHVPDGDPCPRHGLPTRLEWIAGAGFFSNCRACDQDFLAEYYRNHIGVTPAVVGRPATPAPPPAPAQMALL